MMHDYYGTYSTGYGFGGGLIDFVVTILFWVLVIYLVINIVRWLKSTSVNGYDWHDHWHDSKWKDKWERMERKYKHYNDDFDRTGNYMRDQTPLDVLKDRYARGEITKMQYEEMRRDLGY